MKNPQDEILRIFCFLCLPAAEVCIKMQGDKLPRMLKMKKQTAEAVCFSRRHFAGNYSVILLGMKTRLGS